MIKTYSELITLSTFKERYEYLRLGGVIGQETFGFDRYLNQTLYTSREWRRLRDDIMVRDDGCDLGIEGFYIHGRVLIHHITPITIDDIIHRRTIIFDPENLITTSLDTHAAIHYGDENLLEVEHVERQPNDTSPWLA